MSEIVAGSLTRSYALPCGGVALFDGQSSTYAFRCNVCFAVVGSVGMPRECFAELEAESASRAALAEKGEKG